MTKTAKTTKTDYTAMFGFEPEKSANKIRADYNGIKRVMLRHQERMHRMIVSAILMAGSLDVGNTTPLDHIAFDDEVKVSDWRSAIGKVVLEANSVAGMAIIKLDKSGDKPSFRVTKIDTGKDSIEQNKIRRARRDWHKHVSKALDRLKAKDCILDANAMRKAKQSREITLDSFVKSVENMIAKYSKDDSPVGKILLADLRNIADKAKAQREAADKAA